MKTLATFLVSALILFIFGQALARAEATSLGVAVASNAATTWPAG